MLLFLASYHHHDDDAAMWDDNNIWYVFDIQYTVSFFTN